MVQIGQTAKITVRGADLTHLTDDTPMANALLVYQSVVTDLTKADAPPIISMDYRGVPGCQWRGALSRIVADLWPARANRVDPITGKTMNVTINEYLRATQNAVCIHRGGGGDAPLWWIRSEWNGQAPSTIAPTPKDVAERIHRPGPVEALDEARTANDHAVESEPSVNDVSVDLDTKPNGLNSSSERLACRVGCDQTFTTGPSRASHERSHGRRPAIIAEARRLYELNGDFTVKDVSLGSGYVDASGAYNFFPSKDAILREVLDDIAANPSPVPLPAPAPSTSKSHPCPRCGQVCISEPGLTSHVRGHDIEDHVITMTAQYVRTGNWPPPTTKLFASLVDCTPSTIRDRFVNLDGLYERTVTFLTEQGETVNPPTGWRSNEVAVSQVTDPDEVHALDVIQLFIGFGVVTGHQLTLSSIRFLPHGLNGTRFDAFLDLLIERRIIVSTETRRPVTNNKRTVLTPGPLFDQRIITRLQAIDGSEPLTTGATETPVNIAASLAKHLREAADYAERLETDLINALDTVTDAKAEKARADELQHRLDTINQALGR